jgi:membrane protein YdbS with pleckstrin-like domain
VPEEIVVRPSMKKVWSVYVLCGLLFAIACAAYGYYQPSSWPGWLLALPLLLFLWPLAMHIGRSFTLLTVGDGRLRYQTGMLARSTRTMDLGRLQDVRVDQTAWQRLMNVGSISVETAGEAGQVTMDSIDSPHQRADAILEAARIRSSNLRN